LGEYSPNPVTLKSSRLILLTAAMPLIRDARFF
jgi:hypothetical protein